MKVVTKEKKGFKRTEVGVIPEDWVLGKVGEVVDMDPENLSSTTNPVYNFDYVSLEDVSRGIIKSKTKIQFADSPSRARRILRIGDVGFGTVRPTNQSHFLINKKVSDLICSTGFAVLRPHRRDINSEYLFYLLFSDKVNQQITQIIAGSNYPAVNSRDVKKLRIPIPPTLEEQQAIADALSDVDELIRSLDALIQKKEAIKKGTMQQLLTPSRSGQAGNKRLSGFDGEWEVKRLGDIVIRAELGGNYSNSETNSKHPLIKMGNLGRGRINLDKAYYIEEGKSVSKTDKLKYGDLLFNTRNTPILVGKVAIWRNELSEAYYNSNLMKLEFDGHIVASNFFMNYLLNTDYLIEKLQSIATGTTSVAAIYTRDLFGLEISIPKGREQKAIAQILSDMDEELQTLRQKRDKMRRVKEGMMQELLTGKTRLV